MAGRAIHEQQGEDHDVQLAFPDLCRPERLVPIGMIGQCRSRIDDAECRAGWSSKGVSVQEVRTAAKGLADYNCWCQDVHHRQSVDSVPPCVEDADEYAEQHAALDGHATLPDIEQFRDMVLIVLPVKKEHIPEPGADDAAKTAVDADIHYMFMPAAILLCEEIANACSQDDAQAQHDAVSPDGEITNVE